MSVTQSKPAQGNGYKSRFNGVNSPLLDAKLERMGNQ